MIKEAIAKLIENKDLAPEETRKVFKEIFEKRATPSQISAFLVALKKKGETYQEISSAAKVIREKAKRVKINRNRPLLDTCGTGGSKTNKFNISTAVAFVVASAGIRVAKHGNRGVSSPCGSADVLKALGIDLTLPSSTMEEALRKIGIAFLYAPLYHSSFAVVAPIRREIGIITIFNILGPLCNPGFPTHQLLGVFSPDLVLKLANALGVLGVRRAFVVYGEDIKDEISLTGKTLVGFLDKKRVRKLYLSPSSFGLRRCALKDLQVNNVEESARVILDVFAGKRGAAQDIVLANASACFYILNRVKNLKEGVELAKSLIIQGKVREKFSAFKDFLTR
ncbi:MAG: anthranilate phosphoribosyltransferase [Candidatus Omnitrophota bacterium]|nr:MAG: anthranilate phosphoribosyltransferase [Candidatus Omnitrophota bacterium]